jgi:hypothetical protein
MFPDGFRAASRCSRTALRGFQVFLDELSGFQVFLDELRELQLFPESFGGRRAASRCSQVLPDGAERFAAVPGRL